MNVLVLYSEDFSLHTGNAELDEQLNNSNVSWAEIYINVVLHEVQHGLNNNTAQVSLINLSKKTIQTCLECSKQGFRCAHAGPCETEDDFNYIYQIISESDAIITLIPGCRNAISKAFNLLFYRIEKRKIAERNNFKKKRKPLLIIGCIDMKQSNISGFADFERNMHRQLWLRVIDRLFITDLNYEYMLPIVQNSVALLCNEIK